jgi:ABC-2 type transport system ATP-binding protein
MDEPVVARLAADAVVDGQRWSLRMPTEQARTALGQLTSGAAYAALDDFTLATPSLEDVYLALGGRARDLEHGG